MLDITTWHPEAISPEDNLKKAMKFETTTRLILFLSVMPLICQSPSVAQGISEYGGVMSIPKHLPTGQSKGTLNKLYGSSANVTSGVSKGASGAAKNKATTSGASSDVKPAVANVMRQSRKAQEDLVKARQLFAEKVYDKAAELYKSSLNIRLQYWKGKDTQIPEIYKSLAEIYAIQGKLDDAEEALKGSIASYARLHGPGSKYTRHPLEKLGDIYDKQGEHWKSHDHYLQSFMLTERYEGKDSKQAMQLRLNMARKANDLGKFKRSADFYNKALAINNEKNILSQDQLLSVLDDFSKVLLKLNLPDEASKLKAQAQEIRDGASGGQSE